MLATVIISVIIVVVLQSLVWGDFFSHSNRTR